jgi:hypothetical protein
MKVSSIPKNLLPGLTLLLATGVVAMDKTNKGSFQVTEPVTVAGHKLAPGQYKLTWDGAGPGVEAKILSNGKLVVTVPANVVDRGQPERFNAAEVNTKNDGSYSLTQVDFAGKKYALSFGDESTESTSAAGSQ